MLRKLYGITEDDEQYTIEKEAKTFEDYVELARNNPGDVVAVLEPWNGIPRFVLPHEEDGIKFYPNYSKLLSLYYDFNPDVDPRKFTDVLYKGLISQDYGKFKEDEIDDIILQEYYVRVDLRKLPDDVELVVEGEDDDEDDDRGGGRLPTMKETLEKWHEELNEIYDEEESEKSERKSFEGLFKGKPEDEHDDDDDEGFSPAE